MTDCRDEATREATTVADIPNSALRPEDVPEPSASTAELREFALTFNAYRRVGGPSVLSEVYDEVLEHLARKQSPPLNGLRAACFYLARAMDNTSDPIEIEAIEDQLRELVGHIGRSLTIHRNGA